MESICHIIPFNTPFIIMNIIKIQILRPVPSKLKAFLASPSLSRSSHIRPSPKGYWKASFGGWLLLFVSGGLTNSFVLILFLMYCPLLIWTSVTLICRGWHLSVCGCWSSISGDSAVEKRNTRFCFFRRLRKL